MEKKEFWAPESLRRYLDACAFLDYPRVPLAKYVEGIIRPEDTVLDLGCGPGASSEYLATLCRQVWAVDTSQAGLDSLRERIAKKGTRNITPLDQPFPQGELPVCDVVVALYAVSYTHLLWRTAFFPRREKRNLTILSLRLAFN